jgi:hypothetical protein
MWNEDIAQVVMNNGLINNRSLSKVDFQINLFLNSSAENAKRISISSYNRGTGSFLAALIQTSMVWRLILLVTPKCTRLFFIAAGTNPSYAPRSSQPEHPVSSIL